MSLGTWTLKRPAPSDVLRVPVYGDAPFYQEIKVVPGQAVSFGMKLAESRGAMGAPVYCPANGVVAAISKIQTASGEKVFAVEIQVDQKNPGSFLSTGESADWNEVRPEILRARIHEMGVLLCGAQARPLAAYLEKGPFHARTLIVNACESEPYVTCGEVLMVSHPLEVLKGVEILRRAAGLEKAVIAVSANAEQSIEVLKSKIYFLKWKHIEIRVCSSRFPQDDPAVLLPPIDPFFARQKPSELHTWPLPDIASAYAAYEAVAFGKPFFERVVTVTGECVVQPQNVWLAFGMNISDALKVCKNVLREPGRVIAGGPMRGHAVENIQAPVSSATDAIIALPKEWTANFQEADCIRCGECTESCPVDLSPALIAAASKRDAWQEMRELSAARCIRCGNCSYVCPSHLPLVELIQRSAVYRGI